MNKLKKLSVALCLCVCMVIGVVFVGCDNPEQTQEIENLQTQIEQLQTDKTNLNNQLEGLQTENEELALDRAISKFYEAYLYTADDSKVNATFNGSFVGLQDLLVELGSIMIQLKMLDFGVNKVYMIGENSFVIGVDENKIMYQVDNSVGYNFDYQLTLTLDESDNITSINFIKKGYSTIGAGTYNEYYEANYTINSNVLPGSLGVDTFEIIDIIYDVNGGSGVEEFMQIGGTYNKLFSTHYDYSSNYNITEIVQYNADITVDGELTVNETLDIEQANEQLNLIKDFADVSAYPVEEIEIPSVNG